MQSRPIPLFRRKWVISPAGIRGAREKVAKHASLEKHATLTHSRHYASDYARRAKEAYMGGIGTALQEEMDEGDGPELISVGLGKCVLLVCP